MRAVTIASIVWRRSVIILSLTISACTVSTDTPELDAQKLSQDMVQTLSPAELLSMSCSGCHYSGSTAIPAIDALGADTLYDMLVSYKTTGPDQSVMHRLMRGYNETELRAIADYLGTEPKADHE